MTRNEEAAIGRIRSQRFAKTINGARGILGEWVVPYREHQPGGPAVFTIRMQEYEVAKFIKSLSGGEASHA